MDLRDYRTAPDKRQSKEVNRELLAGCVEQISELQYRLYAENRQSLLVILQGMDSCGKDGTIKEIMKGVNPQGVTVCSFKHPSAQELDHDFLWRHAQRLPGHGEITIFNRSHYENVLISRVHPELVLAERLPGIFSTGDIGKRFWKERYERINMFEKMITSNGTRVLKFFLHLSKDEQRQRFLARLENKERHWKFSSADITERGYWNEYQEAYAQALRHTSTEQAPWYVIPADDKPYAHLAVATIILERMKRMDPKFPQVEQQEEEMMKAAYEELSKG